MESLQPKTTPTTTTSTSHSTRTPSKPTCGWVFIGSSPNNDIDYIGTSLHVYTGNLLQVKVHDSKHDRVSTSSCAPPTLQGLHRQAHCTVVINQRHHAATFTSTATSTSPHSSSTSAKHRRCEATPATCLLPMKQNTPHRRAPTRRRQCITSDTDKADTTRPGTDEAKAAHLSELTRPDIFILERRQAEGIWLSIARATRVPLHPSTSSSSTVSSAPRMEKTRLEDDDHCSSLIGGGPWTRSTDVINREPSEAPRTKNTQSPKSFWPR
ncbi:hypothetical protein BRADI_2g00467v3 [Brachypodium distachyon]|uniref:Uncharacterized protein n=1 Tax=Brachypodium distachyon TaxID=15368 RepID=A0A0Q3MD74_BRADI|nr:hypothetical protein BRADI_2g00467v3 [Brachypodium distachyon]